MKMPNNPIVIYRQPLDGKTGAGFYAIIGGSLFTADIGLAEILFSKEVARERVQKLKLAYPDEGEFFILEVIDWNREER